VSKPTKYVFVTGGVLSGLGKGITAASIGNLLKARGLKVNIQKCDPYLNVDAGTLNPREHGECFVTRDGAETDLDLGHYERFLDEELTQASSLMAGRVLLKVIQDERAGRYEGRSVQIIPHVTSAIQEYIKKAAEGFDVHIVEIGGTVGDYESLSFIEAIREFGLKVGLENCLYVHLVYLPYLGASQEFKTKPAQNSVRELRGLGIIPNILIARSELPPPESIKHKLNLFCGVGEEAIALLPNARSIYEVPLTLEDSGLTNEICKRLGFKPSKPNLKSWRTVVDRANSQRDKTVNVGIVAKYLDNSDTYMSVFEALKAAAWQNNCNINISSIDAVKLEKTSAEEALKGIDGIVVPGGFGSRGVEGKIKAAQYALTHKMPYLGLCYGMHMMVAAAARNAGLTKANTTEVDPNTPYPIISTMDDQKGKENTGGTMRLGNYDCEIVKDSLANQLYGTRQIVERHRHRYEANNEFRDKYESWGIRVAGINKARGL
jgi:CTP synthase